MNNNFKVLFLSVFLAGCSSKQPFELAEYEKHDIAKYPPISFTLNDGYVASSTSCNEYGCYSYRDNSDFFILAALRETNLFERVDINNAYSEYGFDITFSDTSKDSEGVEFSKLMLGAATLFIVPTFSDKKATFSVKIRHKDKIIKEYMYEGEYEETSFIMLDPQSSKNNAIDYFISLLARDLEKDSLFKTNP